MPNPSYKKKSKVQRAPRKSGSVSGPIQRRILQAQLNTQTRDSPSVLDALEMHIKRNKVYTISQTLVVASPSTTFGSYQITLSQLDQSSSLALIFDEFRFLQFVFDFYAPNPPSTTNFATAIDPNSATVPVSYQQVLNYQTSLVTQSITPWFQRIFAPHYVVPGVTSLSLATTSNGWIPTNNAGTVSITPWGFLKWGYDGTFNVAHHVNVTAIVAFRNIE
jgi:hypothetical protein